MNAVHSVLLVHNEPDAFRGLEDMLRDQEIQTSRVSQCAEAREVLQRKSPVDLVLTDVVLSDGTWKDVIRSVRRLAKNTPVIVMSRVVDMKLYLDTQDAGAADFIVPPMAARDLAHTITAAMHRRPLPGSGHAPVGARNDRRNQALLQ
jgi:DNA-binding NtrC family response regulator